MGEVILPGDVVRVIRELQRQVAELERRTQALTTLPTYTTATKPAASAVKAGTPIFVSDAADGSRFQGSDGTNWKTLG